MSWDGRELISQTLSNGTVLSYAYNSSGIRTRKTYGTSYRKDYLLDGTTVVAEIKTNLSNNSKETIYYFYDETGVAGFEYNGAKYHYIKNLQGDIISIQNANGIVVVNYAYDAWGNVLSLSGTSAVIIGTLNPFRYRGYYYDTETGYYYLNSRYYDPVVGRFLNADGYVSTGQGILGNNMYAYCGNNPVVNADSLGMAYYANTTPDLCGVRRVKMNTKEEIIKQNKDRAAKGNRQLSLGEMQTNAAMIYDYLIASGWSHNAICAVLANMQVESWINPGKYQNEAPERGYGLVQWDPGSDYRNWASKNGYADDDIFGQLDYLLRTMKRGGGRWLHKDEYHDYYMSSNDFISSTYSVEYLTQVFLYCYERAGDPHLKRRLDAAKYWYDFFYEYYVEGDFT